jgi:hypothetical protein
MWSIKLWHRESGVKLEALKHEEICRFHEKSIDFSERLREQTLCSLRWDWLAQVPEISAPVFVVPGRPQAHGWTGTKNQQDGVVLLNRTARNIIEQCKGEKPACLQVIVK